MLLQDVAMLLTEAPTSMVYHVSVIITFTFLLTFLSILTGEQTRRWRTCAISLLAFHITLAVAALLVEVGAVDSSFVFPILDRLVLLTSILLLIWAALTYGAQHALDTPALVFTSLLIVAAVVNILLRPPTGTSFNSTLPDALWAVAGLLLTLSGSMLVAIRRPRAYGFTLTALLFTLAGYVLHFIVGPPTAGLQGFVRWGTLFAYPFFAIAAIQQMQPTDFRPSTPHERAREPEPTTHHVDVGGLAELAGLGHVRGLPDLSAQVVQAIARAMKIEYCLLLSLPDSRGDFSLATGYDLIQENHIAGIPLNRAACPLLGEALVQSQELSLPPNGQTPDVAVLKKLLDLKGDGPVHLIPLKGPSNLLGGLLVLSPYARQAFSADELNTLRSIATHLSIHIESIQNAGLIDEIASAVEEEPPEPRTQLQKRVFELEQENLTLHEELSKTTLEGMQDRVRQMKALTEQYEVAQETIHGLEMQLETISTEPANQEPPTPEYDFQLILGELAEARSRIQELEKESALPAPDVETLARLADDLKKPLTSIRGYVNVLLSESVGGLSTMQRKFLERILDRLERMRFNLKDLVGVAELGTGSLSLEPGLINPLPCLQTALRQIEQRRKSKNLLLRKHIPERLPDILADEDAFTQVLIHFLENAVIVSPEDNVIELQAVVAAREFILLISDRGGGIPQERIPELLAQDLHTLHDPIPGLSREGTGLSIAQALLRAMKAKLDVQVEPGIGTTYRLIFPILPS